MRWLALLLFVSTAAAQDSTAVSFDAWDIRYHVFSGPNYIKWAENPYTKEQAIFLYDRQFLQAVHTRGDGCRTYLPTRRGNKQVLRASGTSCALFDFLATEITKHINGRKRPLEEM